MMRKDGFIQGLSSSSRRTFHRLVSQFLWFQGYRVGSETTVLSGTKLGNFYTWVQSGFSSVFGHCLKLKSFCSSVKRGILFFRSSMRRRCCSKGTSLVNLPKHVHFISISNIFKYQARTILTSNDNPVPRRISVGDEFCSSYAQIDTHSCSYFRQPQVEGGCHSLTRHLNCYLIIYWSDSIRKRMLLLCSV